MVATRLFLIVPRRLWSVPQDIYHLLAQFQIRTKATMRVITVSTCNLNQLALDFVGNFERILEAVRKAKADGSSLIITPELSLSGYSCLDAFLEQVRPQKLRNLAKTTYFLFQQDTEMHCWEVLHDLIAHDDCQGIIVDIDCPSIHLGLNGVEIICNSSASHWQLRKLDRRLELIQESSKKGVDLDQMWDARFQPARRTQAAKEKFYPSIELDASFTDDGSTTSRLTPTKPATILKPEEEIGMATGCWMWDYIRRASAAGAFLPLSGGVDSAATAVMFCSVTRLVYKASQAGNEKVIKDMRRICGEPEESAWLPSDPPELCKRIFHTCYMGTENSSKQTRDRARQLAKDIGSYHIDLNMDAIVKAFQTLFTTLFGFQLHYKSQQGGSNQQGLALQNIQARSRMVLSYLLASTLTFVRGRPGGGSLLVLGSANVDECLRGYYTKYDCSAADINPIGKINNKETAFLNKTGLIHLLGSISKLDLARFLRYAKVEYKLDVLEKFLTAVPTAELEPITEDYTQSDEDDMGCTYEELGIFGRLRKIDKLGPYSMFQRLRLGEWNHMAPRAVFERVRFLWTMFGINRHKQEILTPSLHAETYSPDSNRYDLLPFLRPRLTWQYNKIEKTIDKLEERKRSS
ncbi:MAG: hypothetical protein Q9214_005205 [Letrouitia sp. 1 TL-2023]